MLADDFLGWLELDEMDLAFLFDSGWWFQLTAAWVILISVNN